MRTIKWLRKIDGRYFLFGSHLSLVLIAYYFYNLQRTPLQIGFAYVVAVSVELFCHFTFKKYPNATVADRTLSSLSEAAGLLLLLHSRLWFFHGLTAAVAVASKYLFTRTDGAHIYNPTNFGIVAALTLFPAQWFNIFADEYAIQNYPILHVVMFGLFAIWFGGTYMVTIGYLGALLLAGGISQCLNKTGFISTVYPEIGTFGMIFAFLMITDPKTTPRGPWARLAFGSIILGLTLALRAQQVVYANFIALFLVTLARHILHTIQYERGAGRRSRPSAIVREEPLMVKTGT